MDDLIVKQGETTTISWPIVDADGTPMDLTGWAARGQVRKAVSSDDVLYEWTSEAANITTASSSVTISVPAGDSSSWDFKSAVYGVEMESTGGQVVRIAQGRLTVDPEVVR